MNSVSIEWKSRDFLVITLFLPFIACASMFLDVPVARQVIGFINFTFVPGFVFIKLLKLNELDRLETALFSVGLSVAFLMLAGVSINEFCHLFGILEPLSFLPLAIILNGFILIGGVLAYLRTEGTELRENKTFELHPLLLFLIGLPILTIIGTIWVKAYNNNLLLLSMIMVISLLFVIAVTSKKLLPPKLYPIAIFVIALSLLYHWSLASNYIISLGSDVPREYFIFRNTQNNAYWNPTNPYADIRNSKAHSMLSITILPTIYSNLLNVDPAWVFKILYPLIFSFVPLGLYKVWKGDFGSKYAFISTFLFMSNAIFYTEMLGLNRQMIAELFFVLLLFTILNKKMKPNSKITCFIVFSIALVTSHYGLAEIFLIFISLALILLIAMKRPSRNIRISMTLFFFVVMFSWYIFTTSSAVFESTLYFGEYTYNSLRDIFNLGAREQEVLRGLGLESPPTIWNAIGRGFAYTTQFLMVAGFIGLIARAIRKRRKIRLDKDLFIFISIAMVILASLVVVPGLSKTLNMTRFYHILLFFLAPLCVLGAEFLVGLMFKQKGKLWISILLLIVLTPYFLFQTEFVYEVTGSDSWSVPLSKHRMKAYKLRGRLGYVDERDVFSAQWILKNVDIQNTQMYAGLSSRNNVLFSYGLVSAEDVIVLSNVTSVTENGTIYLNRLNIVEGIILGNKPHVWNKTDFSFIEDLNRIYSNGGSEIYRNMDKD